MKNNKLKLPANYSRPTARELADISGGSAIGDFLTVAEGVVTGLASAGADVLGSVLRGEVNPIAAICTSVVYLAGNVVASILWAIL